MTLSEIKTMLESIDGFEDKVAYREFPVKQAPALPFICYLCTSTDNFVADNQVYAVIQEIDIELYSRNKDIVSEAAIEAKLNENNIVWEKYEEYISSEKVYEIVYTITINNKGE